MALYAAHDIARAFRTVRKNTIQIAEEIPEDKYDFRAAEGCRTVAETLRHIAVITQLPLDIHGPRLTQLDMQMFGEEMAKLKAMEAALQTKADILKALNENGEAFAGFVDGLSDDVLAEMVHFAPEAHLEPKSRFEMLLSAKEHEMHHRAQLMVIERMVGITPHLTRQMQERMAARSQGQSASA